MDELRAVLELATNDELETLTDILFRRKFNPLDYVYTPEPIDVQSQDRQAWLDAIEERFRFLAADGMTVLRQRTSTVDYRHVLIRVCRFLKIPYSRSYTTADLEAEIFLFLLQQAWERLSLPEQRVLKGQLQTALSESEISQQLPSSLRKNPFTLLLKGGSAIAISSVIRPFVLQQIARQFAIHAATYHVARQAIVQGGTAAAVHLESQVALQTAARGMAVNAARYSLFRSVFAVVGPAMWAWFLADLGWRTIATNYGRVIPAVFALAQIRLTRMVCLEPAV